MKELKFDELDLKQVQENIEHRNEYQHNHEDHQHNHEDHQHTHEEHQKPHKHIHSQEDKRMIINRLSRAIGHLESVKRMVEQDQDCSAVLIQLAAVRAAINNTGKEVLKNHMSHCIVEAIQENDEQAIQDLKDAVDKFIK